MTPTPGAPDAVVIGAGTAGLAAAGVLTRAGLAVSVLEARDRVGGRVHSARHGDGWIDSGATWFWPGEPLIGSLAETHGIRVFPQHTGGDALFEAPSSGVQRLTGNPVDTPSYRFADGARSVPEHLLARLPPGTVRLGDAVTAVAVTPDEVRVRSHHGLTVAPHAVIAVPPALAIEHLAFTPGLPRALVDTARSTSVWMGGITKAVAVYDRPFWRDTGLSGSAVSYTGPFREFHDHSGPEGSPAALFAFAPSRWPSTATTDMIDTLFRRQLSRLFGAGAGTPRHIRITDWGQEEYTSPRRPSPQATTGVFGAAVFRQPVHGRLHWASTETATDHAGHLEGALRAGIAAATAIVGEPAPWP